MGSYENRYNNTTKYVKITHTQKKKIRNTEVNTIIKRIIDANIQKMLLIEEEIQQRLKEIQLVIYIKGNTLSHSYIKGNTINYLYYYKKYNHT